MNKYEMLYILDATATDEAKEATIAKIEAIVTENGGTVEKTDKWGVKKLNYPINYKAEGYYVLMNFECDPALVAELTRVCGINELIIRNLITKA